MSWTEGFYLLGNDGLEEEEEDSRRMGNITANQKP